MEMENKSIIDISETQDFTIAMRDAFLFLWKLSEAYITSLPTHEELQGMKSAMDVHNVRRLKASILKDSKYLEHKHFYLDELEELDDIGVDEYGHGVTLGAATHTYSDILTLKMKAANMNEGQMKEYRIIVDDIRRKLKYGLLELEQLKVYLWGKQKSRKRDIMRLFDNDRNKYDTYIERCSQDIIDADKARAYADYGIISPLEEDISGTLYNHLKDLGKVDCKVRNFQHYMKEGWTEKKA